MRFICPSIFLKKELTIRIVDLNGSARSKYGTVNNYKAPGAHISTALHVGTSMGDKVKILSHANELSFKKRKLKTPHRSTASWNTMHY